VSTVTRHKTIHGVCVWFIVSPFLSLVVVSQPGLDNHRKECRGGKASNYLE
jgi:hypothetical protein